MTSYKIIYSIIEGSFRVAYRMALSYKDCEKEFLSKTGLQKKNILKILIDNGEN